MTKRLGVLTSGGDCAGLNAVIRAVTLRATQGYGWQVFGIKQGTMGLMSRPVEAVPLNSDVVDVSLIRQGGTFLGTTNRGNPFAFPMPDGTFLNRSQEIIEGIRALKLDALIGVGGDGSQDIMYRLSQQGGFEYIAIPKTIDNDVGLTEQSIGFMTAVDVATEALDRLQPTAASHDRVMILEVMGRDAGHIALHAGIAGGADVILIPEVPYRIELIASKIRKIFASGRNFALIVISEAVLTEEGEKVIITDHSGKSRYGGISHYLADKVSTLTGAETRYTVLGHVQRGGQPSSQDRLLASAFGVYAVDLIAQGKTNRMVTWQNREVVEVPLDEAIQSYQAVDINGSIVHTARGLGISFGDRF
ncbi:6-phosphofructokinase I [Candidatus Bealeia paramacronuclearis]|uniref:ATP-dependent 6-phosphofructokinase n=1 Tax=Candidatus Bealeia paramacronuclearis TaxID=1921001 RepID=A0ABZ2C403_9PROT|nr:6-phosphofructokinase I [Candidatus Bealeia paramacronuclearis]